MKTLELQVRSRKRCEMIEITSEVAKALSQLGGEEGVLTLFTPHTTAALTINENADPDVVTDVLYGLDKLAPEDPAFRHAEGNSAAHIKSSLIGASETILYSASKLQLGTWQGVYFCEFDGPRTRRVTLRLNEAR